MKKQVVVIGLGRFGSSVTQTLYNQGHDVLAIDEDESRVQDMMGNATHVLVGDATSDAVLRELGIPEYDMAIVAIGANLVSSVMVSVMLKTLDVEYIVARAKDRLHANTLERLGVNRVVQVEAEMGARLAHSLFHPDVQEYMEILPNFGISKLRVPSRFSDMSIGELPGLDSNSRDAGLSALAISRGKRITLKPSSKDKIRANDWLVLAGNDELLDHLTGQNARSS